MAKSIDINKHETIDDLQVNGYRIIQSDQHFKFSIDAVLLSHYTSYRSRDIVMDMCSGTGVVGLLVSAHNDIARMDCIEIQEYLADMCRRSIELNELDDSINSYCMDLRTLESELDLEQYDGIVCNPPYLKVGQGKNNDSYAQRVSRFEQSCTIDDVCRVSTKMLKNKGKLTMVHRAERMAEVLATMKKHRIEPKRLQPVYSYATGNAVLFLVEGIKNANENMVMETPLIIYNSDGTYTDQIYKIYKMDR